jgi:hypothetical protein
VIALVGNDGHQPVLAADTKVSIEWQPEDGILLPAREIETPGGLDT